MEAHQESLGPTWSWAATPESVLLARCAVVDYLRAESILELPLADIALATSEALTNVVVHAYAGEVAPGMLRVALRMHADHVILEVSDDGHGVAPRRDSPGLGLGMPLMAMLSDGLELEGGSAGGTCLRMRFPRASAS